MARSQTWRSLKKIHQNFSRPPRVQQLDSATCSFARAATRHAKIHALLLHPDLTDS